MDTSRCSSWSYFVTYFYWCSYFAVHLVTQEHHVFMLSSCNFVPLSCPLSIALTLSLFKFLHPLVFGFVKMAWHLLQVSICFCCTSQRLKSVSGRASFNVADTEIQLSGSAVCSTPISQWRLTLGHKPSLVSFISASLSKLASISVTLALVLRQQQTRYGASCLDYFSFMLSTVW